jgi:hypothetical protein
MSGQVAVAGQTLESMGLPAMGAFLRGTSRRMRTIATAQLQQARLEAGLAGELADARQAVAAAAEAEAAEGLAELARAQDVDTASTELRAAGDDLIARAAAERAEPEAREPGRGPGNGATKR